MAMHVPGRQIVDLEAFRQSILGVIAQAGIGANGLDLDLYAIGGRRQGNADRCTRSRIASTSSMPTRLNRILSGWGA